MPRYEYECKECGLGVELSRPVAERNDPLDCENPECVSGPASMELVPSLGAFALKGTGWTAKGGPTPAPPKKRVRRGLDMRA